MICITMMTSNSLATDMPLQSRLRRAIWAFGPALLAALFSCAALVALDLSGRAPGLAMPLFDVPSALILVALVPYLGACAVAWQRLHGRMTWPAAWRTARAGLAGPDALIGLGAGVVLARILLVQAVAWKYGIGALGGFHDDAMFRAWDAALHAGRAPWHLFAGLLRWPWLWFVDRFYAFWFVAFMFVVIRESWRAPDGRQRRFFLAFALTWIVGSVAAALLPSAGPVYFARVTGQPGAYAGLTAALQARPLLATQLQADLWSAYAGTGATLVKGIAAFPSLHVAMPALYAVSSWGRNRREGIAWWVFTAATIVCSVVLGWHYAVDGYAAILGVVIIWWATGARIERARAGSL